MKRFLRFVFLGIISSVFTYNVNAQCVYTIAGGGSCYGCSGTVGTNIAISYPYGLTADDTGNVFFSETSPYIYETKKSGYTYVVAGNGVSGFSGDGGKATLAKLGGPAGVAVDDSGNIFIADQNNNRIREVRAKTGIINTIAGTGAASYSGDGGPATAAKLKSPVAVAVDDSGNVYIADQGNNRIRKIYATTHTICTITGNGIAGFSGDGTNAAANGVINQPYGVAVDTAYNVYISDFGNARIREIMKSNGTINTIAGNGTGGHSGDGGLGMLAEIFQPYGIAVDKKLNVFFAEESSNDVRRIDGTTGDISTVAGSYTLGNGYNGDGMAADTTEFYDIAGLGVDGSGDIFVSDVNNERVREIKSGTPPAPVFLSSFAPQCAGEAFYLQVSGGSSTIGWYSDSTGGTYLAGGTTYITDTLFTTTTFYVQDSSWCGVSKRTALTIVIKPAPTVKILGNTTFCQGTKDTLIGKVTGGSGVFTYLWSPSGITKDTTVVTYNSTNSITVNDTDGCTAYASISVVTKTASLNLRGDTNLGCGSYMHMSAVTNPPSPTSIAWSPSTYLSSTTIPNPTCTMTGTTTVTYTVTAVLTDGCIVTSTEKITSQGTNRLDSVRICVVGVDTASKYNILTWDNTGNTDIDSLKIFYLNSVSVWQLIHAQKFSGPNSFVDSTAINDPNANTVRYCLAGVDSCGNQEPFPACIWQNTMHITQAPPGTFNWSGTGYLIKNISTPVLTYILYRDSLSNGNWQAIDSVSGTQNTMTDVNYAKYPNGRWYVEARIDTNLHKTCTIPLELKGGPSHAANTSTSRSNQQHNVVFTGVKNMNNSGNISLYPNPATQTVNIKFDNNNKEAVADVKVTDVTGRVIIEESNQTIANNIITLSVATLPSGVYFVEVGRNAAVQVVKFVKE